MERFKKVLFVADPENACRPALDRAVALAANNQADLAVVAVIPRLHAGIHLFGDGTTADDLQAAEEARQRVRLSSLIEPYGRRHRIRTEVLIGTPYLEIIREVLSEGHDLVILSPDGAAWSGRLIGTDEMNLLRKCPCPVWLIKCGGSRSFRRILAAVDVGDSNRPGEETRHAMNCRILEVASALARSECAELHVAYAWDAVGEAIMRGTTVNTPEKYVASMGTVGRTGIPGLLMGNTAETILQQVDCSVLAIKPPGFVTPVTLEA